MMRIAVLIAACLTADPEFPNRPGAPTWLDRVQTYSMLPMLPHRAAENRITVNGVWAGIGGDHPILPVTEQMPPVREQYGMDVGTFVADSRALKLLIPATVNGLEGMPQLKKTFPDLDEMACRKADGSVASNGEWSLMCHNNPRWVAAQIKWGKKGIDDGADLIQTDTPMGSAFIAGAFLKGGFCDYCVTGFERYLDQHFTPGELRDRFGIDGFDRQSIVPRLHSRQQLGPNHQPFVAEQPDDLLFRQFIFFQEQTSFDARKNLHDALRRYASRKGRRVAFSTNAGDLGTMNPFGHWVRGLMFADLVDIFVYEQAVLPMGLPSNNLMPLPRGRWAAYHKLAHAVTGRRNPAVIHASQMGPFLTGAIRGGQPNRTAWFGVLAAEAYATNGAFVNYYVASFPEAWANERFWGRSVDVNAFVLDHADLYEGGLKSGSPLAMVVLMTERGRTIPSVFPSYLGFAQALAEATIPFDVVFGGDGYYVGDRLTDESLVGYDAIIVPSPIEPTENQRNVIQRFIERGGTVVCLEPDRLGINRRFARVDVPCVELGANLGQGHVLKLTGEATATNTTDSGAAYFQTYDAGRRAEIARLAHYLGLDPLIPDAMDGSIGAFPVLQPSEHRAVIHLVNYDIDLKNDRVRARSDVRIRLPRRIPASGVDRVRWHAPGQGGPIAPAVRNVENQLLVTVAELEVGGSIVVDLAPDR